MQMANHDRELTEDFVSLLSQGQILFLKCKCSREHVQDHLEGVL